MNVWKLKILVEYCNYTDTGLGGPKCFINGQWVPRKPIDLPTIFERFHRAWWAFSGKASLFSWGEKQ